MSDPNLRTVLELLDTRIAWYTELDVWGEAPSDARIVTELRHVRAGVQRLAAAGHEDRDEGGS